MASVGHETAELDVQFKVGDDINYTWTVLATGGGAYSFANKTDSDLNIYDYEGGTLLKNYGEHASEGLSYSSNAVTLNGVDLGYPPGFYYYEHVYEDSGTTNPTVKTFDGHIEFI